MLDDTIRNQLREHFTKISQPVELVASLDDGAKSVELSSRGEIVIDERGQTSVAGVVAAGDCTTVPYKQIVISMGAGATAALSAFDHLIRTPVPV